MLETQRHAPPEFFVIEELMDQVLEWMNEGRTVGEMDKYLAEEPGVTLLRLPNGEPVSAQGLLLMLARRLHHYETLLGLLAAVQLPHPRECVCKPCREARVACGWAEAVLAEALDMARKDYLNAD